MLLTHTTPLPLLGKTDRHLSKDQERVRDIGAEYKLNQLMTIPNGFHGEVNSGSFDISSSGLIKKTYTLIPQPIGIPHSYLLLQILNNNIFGLTMSKPKVFTSDNCELLITGKQNYTGHNVKCSPIANLFLLRLNDFGEDSPNPIIWFNFSTDMLGKNKTSVVMELQKHWFISHAFSSAGQECCHFKTVLHYLDPNSDFAKNCNDVQLAFEYAQLNTFPPTKEDALAKLIPNKGKYL